MSESGELALAALIGLGTTSSVLVGAVVGLYAPLSRRALACVLAFAAGALISALAIDLAYGSARELHLYGFGFQGAWIFVGGGFAAGSVIYYSASLYLEKRGAAVRYPTRFREYVQDRKQHELQRLIRLLAKCEVAPALRIRPRVKV
jgi:hypothetical protein